MRSRSSLLGVLVWLGSLMFPGLAQAAADDFRVVDGVLAQALALPEDDVVEVVDPHGAVYYIDLRLLPREPVRLEAQTSVTIVGYEGDRGDLIYAHILKVQAVPTPELEERHPADLRLIRGRVETVDGQTLVLRTTDSGTLTVRLEKLIGDSTSLDVAGEMVQILGVLQPDDTFAANVLVLPPPARELNRRR
jgi:hypothetical protein